MTPDKYSGQFIQERRGQAILFHTLYIIGLKTNKKKVWF